MLKSYNNFINENVINKLDGIAGMIDYTELDVDASEEHLYELTQIATDFGFATMCIRPSKVKYVNGILNELNSEKGSDVGITTVISFPDGTDTLEQKKAECEQCIKDGADEIDMVIDYRKVIENYVKGDTHITTEISALAEICHKNGKILKVIVESGLLDNEEQIETVTEACISSNVDYIKTSTGMVVVGAEVLKVKSMKDIINSEGSKMKIKASGGIRTEADIMKFLPLVDRFGIGYGSVNTIYDVNMDVVSSTLNDDGDY